MQFALWSLSALAAILVVQGILFSRFHGQALHIAERFRDVLAPDLQWTQKPQHDHNVTAQRKGVRCAEGGLASDAAVAAVIVVTCNRPEYLKQTMVSLLSAHRRDESFREKFPLFISQDGKDVGVRLFSQSLAPEVAYLNHIEDKAPIPLHKKERVAYYRIANHYKFIMQQLFDCRRYDKLIIVEDDMLFAPDFFPFFEATAQILEQDRSLWCVSSWNDHGQRSFVHNAQRIVRSDFFPGLGWMLRRDTWDGLRDSWPTAYWDDWMRGTSVRKGRECLRPEVCRTYNFGAKGSSSGQFYARFLVPIYMNNASVPWQEMDLSYLLKDGYDTDFHVALKSAREITSLAGIDKAKGVVKIAYKSQKHYEAIAGELRMIKEWKDGIPRGAYQGTVQVNINGGATLVYIVPAPDFKATTEKYVAVDAQGAALTQAEMRRSHNRW